jgi:hypothetical protein
MKYTLLFYANESEGSQTQEEGEAIAQTCYTLLKEAKEAGVLLDNNGFKPVSDATTVRLRDGKTLITDGPFAETHEQLGGFFILDCENLDEAISWAKKIPHAAYGSVEIRPLWSE